ncbi:FAD-binding protein [Lentzea sp. NPDC004789]
MLDIDGKWHTDEARLTSAADDFGHCVHAKPAAVLVPGSAAEIREAVSFAAARGLPIAARGAGHSTYGQGQAAGGLVVDMTGLNTVHEVERGHVVVDAGALWSDVVDAALAQLRTPPVLTDFLGTTVGGTLSAGGFGGASHRHGLQTDNVVALEVVTGTGERMTCSATENRALFDCVRGGLGQFGVITRATVRLAPASDRTRWYKLWYDDLAVFLSDQARLVREGLADHVEGRIVAGENGSWRYRLDLAQHFSTDDRTLIRSLRHERATEHAEDLPHADFLDRMAAGERELRRTGEWFHPHPWLNLLLPASTAEPFIRHVLGGLTAADIGRSGLVIVYPMPTERLRTPLVRKPAGAMAFMLALLRTCPPGEEPSMISTNRSIYDQALTAGGVAYPVNALPMSPQDWCRHFGPRWHDFVQAKHRFDPHGILTPGHGIRIRGLA